MKDIEAAILFLRQKMKKLTNNPPRLHIVTRRRQVPRDVLNETVPGTVWID